METVQHPGSEVMGLVATGCQLPPNADSLKTDIAGPSSSQPLKILKILYHVSRKKSIVLTPKNGPFS